MINGTKEAVSIKFPRFRDAENLPTCELGVEEDLFCLFLRVQRFGTEDVCVLAPMGSKRLPMLRRRGPIDETVKGGLALGSLIPADCCPLFKMKDGEEVS